MKNILEKLKEGPLVFDGAMGTVLYHKGVFINSCYDELCLTRPELILDIHREYVSAGADVLETNTFGANAVKLNTFGLAGSVVEINAKAAALAREAAGPSLLVAGSVGPCSSSEFPYSEQCREEFASAFSDQCESLKKAEVDFLHLETFTCLEELALAAGVAKKNGLPVSASFSVTEEGLTQDGHVAEDMARSLELDENIDIVGINCGVGPAGALEILKRILPISSKPVIVLPNAGYPKDVSGRTIYLTSPEYFAKYAKRFIQLGARGVGGCCGTTPGHIARAVKGIKNLSEFRHFISLKPMKRSAGKTGSLKVTSPAEKSAFGAKLSAGEPVTLIEVLPPKTMDLEKILEKIRCCKQRGADAVNMPDGPRASARVSNMMTGIRIQEETGMEIIPHFCCRDRNLMAMQGDVMAGNMSGIRNLLCVTGDPPNIGDYPDITGVFDVDAIGLVQMVDNLNHGHDLGGNPIGPPTSILIGVAANPCAVDFKREVTRFCRKVDAGAEYAITQPVFDPQALVNFVEAVEMKNRKIPIVAGVWPLASFRNAQFMATEVPGVKVPDAVLARMEKCRSKEESRNTGIALARETCDIIREHVQGFQVSAPFGKVETALKVLGL